MKLSTDLPTFFTFLLERKCKHFFSKSLVHHFQCFFSCPIRGNIKNVSLPFFAGEGAQTQTGRGPSHPADPTQPGAGDGLLAVPAATLHLKDFQPARPLPGLDFWEPDGCSLWMYIYFPFSLGSNFLFFPIFFCC